MPVIFDDKNCVIFHFNCYFIHPNCDITDKHPQNTMIPVIDFSDYGLSVEDSATVDGEKLKSLGQQVKDAFSSVGFCYLKNHGVSEELIGRYQKVSKEFFEQPVEVKEGYRRGTEINFGWVATEQERVNPERPGDFKEAFNYCPSDDPDNWPAFPADFQAVSREMFKECTKLCYRMCDVLSIEMELNKDFMKDTHQLVGKHGNPTTLRTLYYPPITEDSQLKPGQIRLGEHTDYGTITLLFQDNVGGLEVQIPGVGYVPATPIPGTVLVNIGDLMQRWTSDSLLATKHRVLVPEEEFRKRKSRQSIAFFVHPDDDFIIKCLDGSDKYEPISSLDYLNYRFSVTY